MAIVSWICGEKTGSLDVQPGTSVLDVLRMAQCSFNTPCGGAHSCGKCRVWATGALSEQTDAERQLLHDAPDDMRLACFTRVLGDCRITLPTASKRNRIIQSYTAAQFNPEPIYRGSYGVAFDIGTTTVVGYLFSASSAEPLAAEGEMNRQRIYGADVLARINYAQEHTVQPLRELICVQLADILRQLCAKAGVAGKEVGGICVTGNTTMLHIASELDPSSIAWAPFTPLSLFGDTKDLQLPGFPGLPAYLPRCISSYVGADITCSILSSEILRRPGNMLLIDVGTNGEMALKTHQGRLFCCATAAGPAFEGAEISCGSNACEGAVSAVSLKEGKISCQVIGNKRARSICGSGLIDAVHCLRKLGAINYRGRVQKQYADIIPLTDDVTISQDDIRQLQLAKGAIRAGMDALLEESGVSYDMLDEIIFCGGFGSYIDPASAAGIGLIPSEMEGKTTAIGNAAGHGAGQILQSRARLAAANEIAASAQLVELPTSKYFQKRFIAAMNFPQT